jgi:hypothetical protein
LQKLARESLLDPTNRGSGEHLSSSTPVGRNVLFKRQAGLLRFNAFLV